MNRIIIWALLAGIAALPCLSQTTEWGCIMSADWSATTSVTWAALTSSGCTRWSNITSSIWTAETSISWALITSNGNNGTGGFGSEAPRPPLHLLLSSTFTTPASVPDKQETAALRKRKQ